MAQPSDRPRPTSNPHRWLIALAIALAVALVVLALALVGLLLWGRLAFEYYDRDDQSGPDRVQQTMSDRVASEATPLDAAAMMADVRAAGIGGSPLRHSDRVRLVG
jgi:hypothetical protein